jgi:hypothetical protein
MEEQTNLLSKGGSMNKENKKNLFIKDPANWLVKIHQGETNIREVAYELDSLGRSFYSVGNDHISNLLNDLGNILLTSIKMISEGVSENLHRSVQQGEEHSKLLLVAALSGALTAEPGLIPKKEARKIADRITKGGNI